MTDLISRADAIEAVRGLSVLVDDKDFSYFEDALNALPSADGVHIETYRELYEKYVELKHASADAVQGWIPCSERLPSESGDYLCTIPLDADENYTEVLMFHKGRFYEDDAEWGATYHDDVLAWMPLPTPYKGGEDNNA